MIELGAGLAVPTVRWYGESLGVPLIRVNPDCPEVSSARPSATAGAPGGATAAGPRGGRRGGIAQDQGR